MPGGVGRKGLSERIFQRNTAAGRQLLYGENFGKLNEKQKEQCHIGAVMGYITGLQSFINGNDYVGMRRHERPERYQDSFKYCRKQIEEYLKKIPEEKVLPTGQLTLFDLFDMSGG